MTGWRRPLGLAWALASWAGLVLLGCFVLLLVVVAAAPRVLGWQFVVVAGGSMEPTIQFGSIAVMEEISGDEVGPGDVIMYVNQAQKVVTHRVVDYAPDGQSLITRGDANTDVDASPVQPENVHGRYLFSVPEVGNVVHWMHSREGYLAVVLIPGLLIILFELISIVRVLRRSEDKVVTV